jgi:RND family efflux transporter MFP subunit
MEEDPKNYTGPQPGKWFAAAMVGAIVLMVALTAGLVLGHEVILKHQSSELAREAEQGRRVLVARVLHSAPSRTLDLPATIHGYVETPIYAKIAGYLKTIQVDKGDRVQRGEVLAVLEAPELDKQVADAKANYWLASVTDRRTQALLKQGVIAAQQADTSHAQMLQARASYEQLRAMQDYKIVTAPFDGIITARYVDPGALIPQTTTASNGNPIVAMATMAPLRVYIDVPQSLALFIRNGDEAKITVYERPGRTFTGPIMRHPEALNSASRTMLTEIDLPNKDLALYPGMYAKAEITVATAESGEMVRDDSLVFRNGKVYVPVVRNDHLHLVEVTLGYDNGQTVVVKGDVHDDDLVALNTGQAAEEGQVVHPVMSQEQ